jgi:hypothetical protein
MLADTIFQRRCVMKKLFWYGLIVASAMVIFDGMIAVHEFLYPTSEYAPSEWELIGPDGKSLGPAPVPKFDWKAD